MKRLIPARPAPLQKIKPFGPTDASRAVLKILKIMNRGLDING